MTTSKITSGVLSGLLAAQKASGVTLESFGYFLDQYVITGGELTVSDTDGSRFTIDGFICSFRDGLYQADAKSLYIRGRNTVFYVDFTVEQGITVGKDHPPQVYLPLWQVETGPDGNIVVATDVRGEVGGVRFKAEFAGIITDQLIVDEAHIMNDSVSAAKLKTNSVNAEKLQDGAVSRPKIANEAVDSSKLAAFAVIESKLAAGSVTETKLADHSVTSDKMVDGSVTNEKLEDGALTAEKYAAGSVEEAALADGSVTEPKLSEKIVDTRHLKNNAVGVDQLQNKSVTHSKLADYSVTEKKINPAAVGPNQIRDKGVTFRKLAPDVVIKGDSSVEAAQARVNTIMNEQYESLQIRLDSEFDYLQLKTDNIDAGLFSDEQNEYGISGGAF